MAAVETIVNEIKALATHYRTPAMTEAQEERWLKDYALELAQFTDRAVTEAARKWKLGEERRMPGVGQLAALARHYQTNALFNPARDQPASSREWMPEEIGPGEYADMTLRQKARQQRLLAGEENRKACRASNKRLPESEQSEVYRFHRRQERDHLAEAQRLHNLAHG